MYTIARAWGIQPSEFWGMTFSEWFAEYDMHVASAPRVKGQLTDEEIDELKDWMEDGVTTD